MVPFHRMPEREREEVIPPTDPERWLDTNGLKLYYCMSRDISVDNFYNLQCVP